MNSTSGSGNTRLEDDDDMELTSEQISDLKDAFRIFDRDGSGFIDPRKLGAVMKSLGQNPTEAEVQDLISAADDNGNGTIDFDEFMSMMSRRLVEGGKLDDIRGAFDVFDRDGNGVITADDLSGLMARIGQNFTPDEISDMIEAADEDGNKQVTYEDFVRVFKEDG